MFRNEIINKIIDFKKYKNYLEIGINTGFCFKQINCLNKTGVDPNVNCLDATYHMTSDDFFAKNNNKFDIIFIDGLHLADQVDRDIENSLNFLNEGGTIVIHDANPPSETHAGETICYQPPACGNWTGTVYKSIIKLRLNRSDLEIKTVDTDWGVAILTKNNSEKLSILPPNNDITWEYFDSNRKEILNLISVEDFLKIYNCVN